jgi:ABC-type oligopeptide transport system ATPase subunit
MSILEIDGVSKVYKTGTFGGELKPALREVSFDIDKGEVVSLIGQSGSGKSTLGKIILRLVQPSAGAVRFEGSDISKVGKAGLRDYYRHVQGVFQDPFSSYNPLYKADRVFEMVRSVYFPRVRGAAWQARVEEALESVALNPADVLNKFPHQLSGGQQQRLLIARALLLEVRLLVADEIISMLDASTRVDVLNLLVELKRRGLGVLFITHDLSLGNYISDRSVILRDGAVVEMGETPKVFGNAQHPYTKGLLAAVPQLHRKWEAGGVGALVTSVELPAANGNAPNGGGRHSEPQHAEEGPYGGAGKRYSRSSLNPLRRSQRVGPEGRAGTSSGPSAGGRPSLMELEGAPWQRARPAGRGLEAVLAANPAPRLVEVEDGHFVAVVAK